MSKASEEILEQVVAEFTARLRSGEKPAISEYRKKFPALREEIDDLLASVAMIEGLKEPSSTSTQPPRWDVDELMSLKRLGDYRIIRQLGRGGMGIVFEAEHESLGRHVAIKVLPSRAVTDEKSLERFRREARAAANLHHTNIVGVFGVGQHEGFHYYVMELVRGASVSAVLRKMRTSNGRAAATVGAEKSTNRSGAEDGIEFGDSIDARSNDKRPGSDLPVTGRPHGETKTGSTFRKSSVSDFSARTTHSPDAPTRPPVEVPLLANTGDRFRWAAGIAEQTADAMVYAHQQNILHRDIKPSNLMLDGNGTIWITDFGLVKNVTNTTLTATGDIVGTPQYMAPESFEGKYDQRSETYCLGLTLYEMATLRPAWPEVSTAELIRQITSRTPVAAKKLEPKIPRDLATVIAKAISRDPDNRYQTAEELQYDLRAFLEDRPIRAARISPLEHVWRWSRRNPMVASLVALSACLLCLVAVTASAGYWSTRTAYNKLNRKHQSLIAQEEETSKQRQRAEENYQRAEANVTLMKQLFDDMFTRIVFKNKNARSISEIEGFQQLSGIETKVTRRDAEFLAEMISFYERFAAQNSGDDSLLDETARAYRRVANIYHLTGSIGEASKSYEQAVNGYKRLLEIEPDSIERAVALAQTRSEYANVLLRRRQRAASKTQFQSAAEELSRHSHADSPELQIEQARVLIASTADLPFEITPELIRESTSIIRELSGLPAVRRENRQQFGGLFRNDGIRRGTFTRLVKEQLSEDRANLLRANQLLSGSLESNESNRQVQVLLARSNCRIAQLEVAENRFKESNEILDRAIDGLEKLVRDESADDELKFALAEAYSTPAGDNGPESLKRLLKAESLVEDLLAVSSENLEYLQLEAGICSQLGVLYKEDKDELPRAIEYFQRSSETFTRLMSETTPTIQLVVRRMMVDVNFFEACVNNGDPTEAGKTIRSSFNSIRRSLRKLQNRGQPGNGGNSGSRGQSTLSIENLLPGIYKQMLDQIGETVDTPVTPRWQQRQRRDENGFRSDN